MSISTRIRSRRPIRKAAQQHRKHFDDIFTLWDKHDQTKDGKSARKPESRGKSECTSTSKEKAGKPSTSKVKARSRSPASSRASSSLKDESDEESEESGSDSSWEESSESEESEPESGFVTPGTKRRQAGKTPKSSVRKGQGLRLKTPVIKLQKPSRCLFKNDQLEHGLDKFERASLKLQPSLIPDTLPCRDRERGVITDFIKDGLKDKERRKSGIVPVCLYIAGVPGTGKTATVMEAVRKLEKDKKCQRFQFIYINGLELTEPRKLYSLLCRQIFTEKVSIFFLFLN